MLNFPSFALGMSPIRGALFFDAGYAWEEIWEDTDLGVVGSYGIGFRGVVSNSFILRLDIGRRTDFHSKDSSIFTQLFFGYDY